MTKTNTTREVLLTTTSSFAQRELCENDLSGNKTSKLLSQSEKLEQACWNGLLDEWLKGTSKKDNSDQQLFLWRIDVGNTFLCVQLSEAPSKLDLYYSVNPFSFMPLKNMN